MIPHRSFPTLTPLLLVFCVTLIGVPASLGADSSQYPNCSSTIQCGTLQNISYPFWGVNRADYCGLSSNFQLTCVDNTSLQINISGLTYRVLRLDDSTRLFTVARADYNGTVCPHYVYSTAQVTPFSYSSDTKATNLTLYYGCTAVPTALSSLTTSQFTCTVNQSIITGYFLTRSPQDITINGISVADITGYFGDCSTSVVVPANQSAIQTIETSPSAANVEAALNGGFGLQWADDDGKCQSCIDSGGQCGRNQALSGLACYCSDKSYSSTCSEGSFTLPVSFFAHKGRRFL